MNFSTACSKGLNRGSQNLKLKNTLCGSSNPSISDLRLIHQIILQLIYSYGSRYPAAFLSSAYDPPLSLFLIVDQKTDLSTLSGKRSFTAATICLMGELGNHCISSPGDLTRLYPAVIHIYFVELRLSILLFPLTEITKR